MTAREEPTRPLRDEMLENQKIIDELNAKLARKTDEVRIIQQISSELNSTLELGRILDIILNALDSVLGFHHAMILLADEAGQILTLAASRGYGAAEVGAEIPVGRGVFGVVAGRRRIMRMGNIRSQMAYLSTVRARMLAAGQGDGIGEGGKLPGLADAESQMGIPLIVKDRLIGVLGVEGARPNAFNELDEVLLSIVANQVANALDNARLHQATIDRSRALDAANAELSALNATLESKVGERTRELSQTLATLSREKEMSENLLMRMAPPAVIPLMREDKLVARHLGATVLFTDLKGFTAYSAGMEPDEMFAQLNAFFSWAGEIIGRYRGYVNKTIGDGVMALFGVPFESATHQTDAVLAALAMQREIREQFPFNMRIGINSGTITAGMLGPRDKSLYDVLGDAVNIASRMEAVSPVGGIAVSQATRELLGPRFAVEALGEREIEGVGTVACFNVLGLCRVADDTRRVDPTSRFASDHLAAIDEVEAFKRERLAMVDFPSIQARDAALNHNEAVASFALALSRQLRAAGGDRQAIDEDALVAAALLHDVGKHALDPARLNETSPSKDARERLRRELLDQTLAILDRVGRSALKPAIEDFYRFEATRGEDGAFEPMIEMLVAADIYDTLTAPKAHRGVPWRIVGALGELQRLPYRQGRGCAAFDAFVDLMKPKDASLAMRPPSDVLIR